MTPISARPSAPPPLSARPIRGRGAGGEGCAAEEPSCAGESPDIAMQHKRIRAIDKKVGRSVDSIVCSSGENGLVALRRARLGTFRILGQTPAWAPVPTRNFT